MMRALTKKFVNFLKREDGPTTPEYALMTALVIVLFIASILFLSKKDTEPLHYINIQSPAQVSNN